ncbi:hypothetical protein I4200191B4_27690 [Pseudoflavonifractor gallinarum]|uniref:hypothetical protein n=1 Tax=Pseudoflavonifractor gallinarum TaxID=2779352 RepID=UPI0036F277C5
MDSILILNGSPRAPRSNSKRYAQLFSEACPLETVYFDLIKTEQAKVLEAMEETSRVLLVFPLYVDGLPVVLLEFLKYLEEHPPENRPTLSVLINCGFLELEQNNIAVEMIRLFARKNGYPMGAVLKIGGGEAILDTPFRGFARAKIRALARAVAKDRERVMGVTMPLPKKLFLKASSRYWEEYGRKNGVTREQMETMEIEG